MKVITLLALFVLFFCSLQNLSAQNKCGSTDIYSKKDCSGDESAKTETELFRLINEYRKQNSLPEVPESKTMFLIANRHLLDINLNLKKLTHSWSDCDFDYNNSQTWKCIFDAPKKFDPAFTGTGYENVYYNSSGKFTPADALEGWKKSQLHNAAILNLDSFKETPWIAGGVAIDGQYANLWFLSTNSNTGNNVKKTDSRGLGVSFKDTVKNLTSVLSIGNVSSTIDSEKWVGTSADKSVFLDIYGKPEEVTEGKLGIRIKLAKANSITPQNKKILSVFLENVSPDWITRSKWLDEAIQKLSGSSKIPVAAVRNEIIYELSVDKNNFLNLIVKPKPKTTAVEIK
ncbi:hypothetical protein BH20ACI4_BH20ACI4_00080 [soil metagenome]